MEAQGDESRQLVIDLSREDSASVEMSEPFMDVPERNRRNRKRFMEMGHSTSPEDT